MGKSQKQDNNPPQSNASEQHLAPTYWGAGISKKVGGESEHKASDNLDFYYGSTHAVGKCVWM